MTVMDKIPSAFRDDVSRYQTYRQQGEAQELERQRPELRCTHSPWLKNRGIVHCGTSEANRMLEQVRQLAQQQLEWESMQLVQGMELVAMVSAVTTQKCCDRMTLQQQRRLTCR